MSLSPNDPGKREGNETGKSAAKVHARVLYITLIYLYTRPKMIYGPRERKPRADFICLFVSTIFFYYRVHFTHTQVHLEIVQGDCYRPSTD